MREAGDLELLAHRIGQPLVLPEHHPAQQRSVLAVQAALEPALGAPPDRVQRARHPAAAQPGAPHGAGLDRGARAARALVGVVAPQGSDATLHLDDLPHARLPARERLSAHAQHGRLARQRPGRQPHARDGRAAAAVTQRLEQDHRPGDPGAGRGGETARVDDPQPLLAERGPAEQRERGRQRDARARKRAAGQHRAPRRFSAGGPQRRTRRERRGGTARGARRGPPERRPGEQEPGHERVQRDVARMAERRRRRLGRPPDHTRTLSRSAASRVSPIPGTWSSSSTEPKPPCASR